ncbi:MAG: phospholipid-binding protein MlaC [Kiloniellales bacterium]
MLRMVARSGVLSLAAVAVAVILVHNASARADDMAQDAQRFIAELAERASTLLSDEATTPAERRDRFRRMFRESFDVPEVARFVLGRYWRRARPEEREEYLQLFEELVVGTWAPRFADYERERFDIVDGRAESDDLALVNSVFAFPDSDPMRIDWWVGRTANTYRIIDIIVEGVSMRVTHRSEFSSVIRRHGGRLEGLLEALRKKTAQLSPNGQ